MTPEGEQAFGEALFEGGEGFGGGRAWGRVIDQGRRPIKRVQFLCNRATTFREGSGNSPLPFRAKDFPGRCHRPSTRLHRPSRVLEVSQERLLLPGFLAPVAAVNFTTVQALLTELLTNPK